MTVASTNTRFIIDGNGASDSWEFDITYHDVDDISVVRYYGATDTSEILVRDTDYTISLPQDDESVVTLLDVTPMPVGDRIVVLREIDFLQEQNFDNNGPFYAADHENAFDLAVYRCQQLDDMYDRAIKIAINDRATVGDQVDSGAEDSAGAVLVVQVDSEDNVTFGFVGDGNAGTVAAEQAVLAQSHVTPAQVASDAATSAASDAVTSKASALFWYNAVLDEQSAQAMTVAADASGNVSADANTFVPVIAAIEVTLPGDASAGEQVVVKNATDQDLSIDVVTTGGQTIDGASSDTLVTAYESWRYVFDGSSEWMIIGGQAGEISPLPLPMMVCSDAVGSEVVLKSVVAPALKLTVEMNNGSNKTVAAPITFDATDATGTLAGSFSYVYAIPSGRSGFSVMVSTESPMNGGPLAYPVHRYLGAVLNVSAGVIARFTQCRDRFTLHRPGITSELTPTYDRYPYSQISFDPSHMSGMRVRSACGRPSINTRYGSFGWLEGDTPGITYYTGRSAALRGMGYGMSDARSETEIHSVKEGSRNSVRVMASAGYNGTAADGPVFRTGMIGWRDRWLQK